MLIYIWTQPPALGCTWTQLQLILGTGSFRPRLPVRPGRFAPLNRYYIIIQYGAKSIATCKQIPI